MFYKINNKITFINSMSLIGEGSQGKVYLSGNKAVKIYRKPYLKYRSNKDEARDVRLSMLKTKYIILPEDSVFTLKNKYCGHQMEYIETSSDKKILDATKEVLSENLLQLMEDTNTISKANFLMADIDNNICYNGKIYLFDSSAYTDLEALDDSHSYLYRNRFISNEYDVKNGILSLIFNEMILDGTEIKRVDNLLDNVDDIDKKMGEGETLKQYILRK